MSLTIHNVDSSCSRFTKFPRVAVIDNFKRQSMDIDGDGVLDKVTHGEIVSSILNAKTTVELANFDIGPNALETMTNALEQIKQGNISGNTFHAVNLSISDSTDVQELRKLTGLDLNSDNLVENKRKILDILRRKNLFERTLKIIAEVEKVVETGSKVFVAAGNNGIYGVNLYSLVEGAYTIGATNAKGDVEPYSPVTNLVDIYEQGTHNVTVVTVDQEVVGYSIINHGDIEILPENISGRKHPYNKSLIDLNDAISTKCLPLQSWTVYPVKRLKQEIIELLSRESNQPSLSQEQIEKLLPFYVHTLLLNKRPVDFDELDKLILLLSQLDEKKGEYVVFIFLSKYLGEGNFRYLKRGYEGNMIYDPDCSGRKAIHFIKGTSFAVPIAISKYLNAI